MLGNKKIMGENIQYYMDKMGIDRKDFAKAIDVPYSSLTDWINGKTYPRIDKIEKMANYFGISKSDLVEERQDDSYYIDPETRKIAEEIKNDPNQKILFKAARTLSPDDMKLLLQMVDRLKGDEEHE